MAELGDSPLQPSVALRPTGVFLVATEGCTLLCVRRMCERPAGRPTDRSHLCHALSRSHGRGMWTCRQWLTLEESPFLNTRSRFAKVPASDDVARWSNWESVPCNLRLPHAPQASYL